MKKWELEKSKVIDLKSLVEYSDGGIISKTLMENSVGNLTLFSFDLEEFISEHSAPFDAIVQVIEGKIEFIIGKDKVTGKEGSILIMPANIPHAVKAKSKSKMLLTMIRGV